MSATEDETLHVESHDQTVPEAWSAFMRTGWGDRELDLPIAPVAAEAAKRRAELTERFPGERLVLPAGGYKVRSNDTDYRFRPDTAHTYYSGNQTSDGVLVIEADGHAVLYARGRSARDTDEFFRDRTYGELWVGRRPSIGELAASLDLEVRPIAGLEDALRTSAPTRTLGADPDLDRVASEQRLIKSAWEVEQLAQACEITARGFNDVVADWETAQRYGERWIEGTFFRRARTEGNDLGYDSIVAGGSHATTLHWIENTGAVRPGELILLDMGVEGRELYTADITRTLPINGTFSPLQRDLYTLVLQAQEAGIAAVRPGARFMDPHAAAMRVLAYGLQDLGLLPVSAEESLDPQNKTYARWTLHGTSHMLGMDVHDCAAAADSHYREATLAEGMVLTVEPGLYFQEDDLLVPEELRGIGIRIEDDIAVTSDGSRNLSAELPRTVADIEAWLGR